MGLINLTTNLKSLKFGKDRIGGGSSNQPYIRKGLPEKLEDLGKNGGPDFLLRGGILTPGRIYDDASRLTQMFFDVKSPNGLLFTAKQNVLSRTAVATDASGLILNAGAYLPTSTILGAAGTPIGGHLNKQGIDPSKRTGPDEGQRGLFDILGVKDPLGLPVYSEVVKTDSKSKLELFLDRSQNEKSNNPLYIYPGGPGSNLGVGKTIIPLSKDRTGKNNSKFKLYTQLDQTFSTSSSKTPQVTFSIPFSSFATSIPMGQITIPSTTSEGVKYLGSKYNRTSKISEKNTSIKLKYGASTKYFELNPDDSDGINLMYGGLADNVKYIDPKKNLSIDPYSDGYNSKIKNIGEDFRVAKGINPKTPSYTNPKENYKRVNLGDPGTKFSRLSYMEGRGDALDKVNALPIYKSRNVNLTKGTQINDFVKFRIGVIDNKNPKKKTYIHFRAIIDGMSDNYSAKWNSHSFVGRGEKQYKYGGFDRSISLSWTVAAQSKQELIPMYQKLNYLASVCAPDYSDNGYMRGNLIELTVGGYLYGQVGIMGGITYSVPTESPWEIAIGDGGSNSEINGEKYFKGDKGLKELPHIIKVSGFKFTPIHDFTPSVQDNKFIDVDRNGVGVISKYGKERYIALSNGSGTSHNNYDYPEDQLAFRAGKIKSKPLEVPQAPRKGITKEFKKITTNDE